MTTDEASNASVKFRNARARRPRILAASRCGAMLLAVTFCGAFGAWAYHATSATAQGTRRITPEGFEFAAKTRSFKYHYPRKYARGTVYSGTWIAESAEEVRPNFVIHTAEFKPTPETSVLLL